MQLNSFQFFGKIVFVLDLTFFWFISTINRQTIGVHIL